MSGLFMPYILGKKTGSGPDVSPENIDIKQNVMRYFGNFSLVAGNTLKIRLK